MILIGILKVFRQMRSGTYDEAELEAQLDSRGLMNRFLGRFTRAIKSPWQMYPLGILFGLGFDTATEVALLFLAAGAAGAGLPFYAILCLPILFAAGMSLLDTIDGSFMNFAYGWALSKPVRKVFYNIAITGLSVAVAAVIGTIELGGLLAQKLNATRPVLVLDGAHRHQRARLHHPRDVRRDLDHRARDLALRADRGALDERAGGIAHPVRPPQPGEPRSRKHESATASPAVGSADGTTALVAAAGKRKPGSRAPNGDVGEVSAASVPILRPVSARLGQLTGPAGGRPSPVSVARSDARVQSSFGSKRCLLIGCESHLTTSAPATAGSPI